MCKIAFISTMHRHDDKRVFQKEVWTLNLNGYNCYHIGFFDDEDILDSSNSVCNFVSLGGSDTRRFLRITRLLLFLVKTRGYDVYHCNELDSWFVGCVLARLFRKKVVFDNHEHYASDIAQMRGYGRFKSFIIYYMVTFYSALLCCFTDHIVHAKRSLESSIPYVFKKRTSTIANYSWRYDNTGLAKEKYKNPTLVHVGLLNQVRGGEIIINILKDHSELDFIQVGEINDEYQKTFLDMVKVNNLSSRVIILDWVPFTEMMEIVQRSHIGIVAFQDGFSNHVNALPHKMFDYMAAGIPVIVPSFALEIARIVTEENCGEVVNINSRCDWKNAISKCLTTELNNVYGNNARHAVISKYNWENEAEKLQRIYQDLCKCVGL